MKPSFPYKNSNVALSIKVATILFVTLAIYPLYFAKNGYRYRSLGCQPCTVPIPSNASTINEIVQELETSKTPERAGRSQDKEKAYMMQKLQSLGYM